MHDYRVSSPDNPTVIISARSGYYAALRYAAQRKWLPGGVPITAEPVAAGLGACWKGRLEYRLSTHGWKRASLICA